MLLSNHLELLWKPKLKFIYPTNQSWHELSRSLVERDEQQCNFSRKSSFLSGSAVVFVFPAVLPLLAGDWKRFPWHEGLLWLKCFLLSSLYFMLSSLCFLQSSHCFLLSLHCFLLFPFCFLLTSHCFLFFSHCFRLFTLCFLLASLCSLFSSYCFLLLSHS